METPWNPHMVQLNFITDENKNEELRYMQLQEKCG